MGHILDNLLFVLVEFAAKLRTIEAGLPFLRRKIGELPQLLAHDLLALRRLVAESLECVPDHLLALGRQFT